MSTAICARWTMVGHHVCHGGYNSLQSENGEVTGRFHRRAFARGVWKRCTDWMDWMLPEVRWRSRLTVFVYSAPVCVGVSGRRCRMKHIRLTVFVYSAPVRVAVLGRCVRAAEVQVKHISLTPR